MIRLYPSLQFALDNEEFLRFAEITQKKMLERDGEGVSDEEESDDDE